MTNERMADIGSGLNGIGLSTKEQEACIESYLKRNGEWQRFLSKHRKNILEELHWQEELLNRVDVVRFQMEQGRY